MPWCQQPLGILKHKYNVLSCIFSWLQEGVETKVRKARKIRGLGYFSCSLHHLFSSLQKERIQLNFRCDVYVLSWFCRGTSWIRDLAHNRMHRLACKFSYAGSPTYFYYMKAKYTLMGIHGHFTLVLYVKQHGVTVLKYILYFRVAKVSYYIM